MKTQENTFEIFELFHYCITYIFLYQFHSLKSNKTDFQLENNMCLASMWYFFFFHLLSTISASNCVYLTNS